MPKNPPPIVSSQDITRAITAQQSAITAEVKSQAAKVTDDPLRQAQLTKAFSQLAGELHKEDKGPGILSSARQPMASALQSFIRQKAIAAGQVQDSDHGPVVRFSDLDLLEWIRTGFIALVEGTDKYDWKTAPDDPDPLPKPDSDHLRVAVFGDWGTGAYGAPVIADSIRKDADGFDMVLHLGDVYYSGQADEEHKLFVELFPYRDDAINRSLNGNHDMYSGGRPFRNAILDPAGRFKQRETHFYVQNRNWVLVGLDTAYKDHDMPDEEVDWLNRILKQSGDRRIVLFSHHQPFSLLDDQGPNLVHKLNDILVNRRIFAWYWGHEHRCALYEKHAKWGLFGRCSGHGGFPYFRDILGPVVNTLTFKHVHGDDENGIPGAFILDGPNEYVTANPSQFGPHGYMSLVFEGNTMREFVHRPDGQTIRTLLLT